MADVNAFLERAIAHGQGAADARLDRREGPGAGLKWCQGKSILNSINLEDGEERFEAVVPLAQRYGAALVVGTIDEDPEHGHGA